jgi:proteasome accessory factor B
VPTRGPRSGPPRKSEKHAAKPATAGKIAGTREDRSKRLLDLVVLLLGARHPVPYREIKEQFRAYQTSQEDAGLRAFERDKADLVELGVPLRYVTPEDDDSIEEPGYVVDLRRYRLPPIQLTPAEVAALVLAGSVAHAASGTTYDEVVSLALKKLALDQPHPDTPGGPGRPAPRPAAPVEPVLVHFPKAHASSPGGAALDERLALLEGATVNRKRTTLRYVSAGSGEAATREVDPYGLVYKEGHWLLVGWCHLRQGVRTFRLDRIASLEVAPKPRTPDFERPPGFDVRRYAARSPWSFETDAPLALELEVRPEAAAVLGEDLGEGARKEPLDGGATLVRMTCSNPEYVVARVLASKGALRVRAPAELRARVRRELEGIVARYRARP